MNPNEAYMIPGFLPSDLPRKTEAQEPALQTKRYEKCWGAVICKEERPGTKAKPDNKILALKIRAERENRKKLRLSLAISCRVRYDNNKFLHIM